MSIRAFPFPAAERQWLTRFVQELSQLLLNEHELQPEFMLRASTIEQCLVEQFTATGRKHIPIAGLCRNPDEPLKGTPTLEALKPVQRGEREFKMSDFAPEYCYWLAGRRLTDALSELAGYGGSMILFHPSDPNSTPPALPPIRAFAGDPSLGPEQLQTHMNAAYALRSAFLAKSKAVFGRGIEKHPQFEGLQFVVPRWNARMYLESRPEAIAEWFSVFPVQIIESPEDGGLILASQLNLDESLAAVIQQLAPEQPQGVTK